MLTTHFELAHRLSKIQDVRVMALWLEKIITVKELKWIDKRDSMLTCLENGWTTRSTSNYFKVRYQTVLKWAERWRYQRSHDFKYFGFQGWVVTQEPDEKYIDD